MKIVIFGNKVTTSILLKNLLEKNYKIHSLVTLDSIKKDSSNISGNDINLENLARLNNINIYNPISYKLNNKKDYNFFIENNFDIGLCTGWQRLIPAEILNTFKKGVFGWHGSGFEFPNGRGRSPINWSIRLGLKKIYHNCFKYDVGIDDGKIVETRVIEIESNEYILDVINKATEHIKESSCRVIQACINDNLELIEQSNHAYISLPKLSEKDGELTHDMSIEYAKNTVRSCSKPFPGSFIINEANQKIRIWRLENYLNDIREINKNIIYKDNIIIIRFKDGSCFSNDFELVPNNY